MASLGILSWVVTHATVMINVLRYLGRWARQCPIINAFRHMKYGMPMVSITICFLLFNLAKPTGAQTDCIKPSFKQRYHDAYVAELVHFRDLISKKEVNLPLMTTWYIRLPRALNRWFNRLIVCACQSWPRPPSTRGAVVNLSTLPSSLSRCCSRRASTKTPSTKPCHHEIKNAHVIVWTPKRQIACWAV